MFRVAEEPVDWTFAGPDPVVLRADQPAGGRLPSEPGAHTEPKGGLHRVSFPSAGGEFPVSGSLSEWAQVRA